VVDDGVKKLVPTSSAAADGDKIYDLICRRFLMMWHDDYLQAVKQMGWKVLDIVAEGRRRDTRSGGEKGTPEQVLPVAFAKGQLQDVANIEARKKQTRPPKRFTEGTLHCDADGGPNPG
jgi:DNA topoisomerase III